MKAIVTGATGFIGQHLVDALVQRGYEVVCLDRRAVPSSSPHITRIHANFDRSDLGIADDVLVGADAVIHAAGATRALSRGAFHDANVRVTERLLDRIEAAGVAPRFLYLSSQAAAGPAMDASSPKRETEPAAPIEDYGRSKLAGEQVIIARASSTPFTILRPVAVYGPGDRDFLNAFRMASRGVAVYPGVRHAVLNMIFVRDLVAGIIAAAESPTTARKTYFLGDEKGVSWRALFEMIAEIAGQPRIVHVKVPRGLVRAAARVGDAVGALRRKPLLLNTSKARLGAAKYWLCSSQQARSDFRFMATTELRDGLLETYRWYSRQGWL